MRPFDVYLAFGKRLFQFTPEIQRREYMPYNDVYVDPGGHDFTLRFYTMLSEKGDDGKIYYSRFRPKVRFHGHDWVVAFSEHAIIKLCERFKPDYFEHESSNEVHSLIGRCRYYKPVTLLDGQPAFTIYDWCDMPGTLQREVYLKGVLGEENYDPAKGRLYHKVGYCGVACSGTFAKAISFWPPGFSMTPEYELIQRSNFGREERQKLVTEATRNDILNEVIVNRNSYAVRWFHDHELPQVIQLDQEIFVE